MQPQNQRFGTLLGYLALILAVFPFCQYHSSRVRVRSHFNIWGPIAFLTKHKTVMLAAEKGYQPKYHVLQLVFGFILHSRKLLS